MSSRTRLHLIAAASLLTAAAVASALDAPDDKRPRALTVAEQLPIEEAKTVPSETVEVKPVEMKPSEVKPAEKTPDRRFSEIPDQVAVVLKLNLSKLYSSPTFQGVADSGDVLAICDELKQIPWTKDGAFPDPIILYAPRMGLNYAMLVSTDRSANEIKDLLVAQYGDGKKVESERTGLGERIMVRSEKTDRKTKKTVTKTEAEILCLTSYVAAFGRKSCCPLDLGFFASKSLPNEEFAKLQDLQDNVIAAGLMRSFPIAAYEDPTGLATLVTSGELMVAEYEPGMVSFVLDLNCRSEQAAEQAARRMKSFLRITLVSFFAADKTLFQELNKSCSTSSKGNTAKLEAKLTKNTMDRVRAFYLLEMTIASAAADVASAVVKTVIEGKK